MPLNKETKPNLDMSQSLSDFGIKLPTKVDMPLNKETKPNLDMSQSLSDLYPWERYEPPYPPSYGLNGTTTVLQGEWLWH